MLTAHISPATSTQVAVNFMYIVQWGKLVCSGYISYSDDFFLSLSAHICISENYTNLNLYVVPKLWKVGFCLLLRGLNGALGEKE